MWFQALTLVLTLCHAIEMCIRTVPPDEYYPTATLPDSPIRTPVRVQPVITQPASGSPGTSAPATTAPGISDPVTTTVSNPTVTPGVNSLCTTCDINTILPLTMPAGTSRQVLELAGTGFCKQTQVTCKRNDTQLCSSVQLMGSTPSGITIIAQASGTVIQVSGTLDCQSDGTYASGATTQIGQISCQFNGCVPACTTCDINALDVRSNLLLATVTRSAISSDANGCSRYTVQCARPTGVLCDPKIVQGVTKNSGTFNVTDGGTINTAFTTLICANDRTWSYIGRGLDLNGIYIIVCTLSCVP